MMRGDEARSLLCAALFPRVSAINSGMRNGGEVVSHRSIGFQIPIPDPRYLLSSRSRTKKRSRPDGRDTIRLRAYAHPPDEFSSRSLAIIAGASRVIKNDG